MTKKNTHYLGHLTDKSNEKNISDAEKNLLDDFIKHEYDQAEWDMAQMGDKEAIASSIYQNIKKARKGKKPLRTYYKYAAAAAIAVVVGLGLLLKPNTPEFKEFVVSTASATDSITLADGTHVYLAANSTFKYPEHFSGNIRSVALLKGNAFFKVTKDPSHPFIITSPEIKTKVLGTSFHISLDHGKSSVTVITGHVRVSAKNQVTFLKPNENALFTASAGLTKHKICDTSLYSWYKKDVDLNEVTLEKVFTLLEFKYGISFNSENEKILKTRITLYLKNGLPLQNILDQIKYVTHLKFKPDGDTINVNY